jgi:hypothetical protein
MSPRHHFADYQKRDPKGYQTFSDSMWNGFVSITHAVGLSPFFSFTPANLQGLDPKAIGKQLGEVYELTGQFAEGEIPGDQEETIQQLPPIE